MFLILVINAAFSLIFICGKYAMAYAPPFFIIGIRALFCGVFYLGFQFFVHSKKFIFRRDLLWLLLALGLFNVYMSNAYELWGLQYLTTAKAAFVYNLAPFFSAFISFIHFGEKLSLRKLFGLIISFLGFIPVFLWWNLPQEECAAHFGFLSLAEVAMIAATIGLVYGWIIMDYLIEKKQYGGTMGNGISMLFGSGMAFAHSWAVETPPLLAVTQWWSLLGWILLIVFLNIIAFSTYTYLLRFYSTTFMAFSGLLCPFVSAFFDWLFFGIVVSWEFYLATALVVSGLWLFYREEMQLST